MNVAKEYHNLDFKLIVETKLGQPFSVHLMAPSLQEKQAWVTDISQVHYAIDIMPLGPTPLGLMPYDDGLVLNKLNTKYDCN